MQAANKPRAVRYYLIILLTVLFLFDLRAANVPSVMPGGNAFPAQTVLTAGSTDHFCPIRIPEKVLIHEEASQNWERWNKRASEQVVFLLMFNILLSFLLLSRVGMSCCIPASFNLPHIRVLYYIHHKDGKGPEDHIFS